MGRLLNQVGIESVLHNCGTTLINRHIAQFTAIVSGEDLVPHASVQQLTAADVAVVGIVAGIGIAALCLADTGAQELCVTDLSLGIAKYGGYDKKEQND